MARVLFAWELGGELGHARRCLRVARELRALGHATAFAFADLAPLAASGDPVEWFQAPALQRHANPSPSPLNASEILINRGFGDAMSVAGALRAWAGLLALWKPDLVVADYAPGALIAARLAKLRTVAIGTGFSMPLPGEPLPALRSWIAMEEGPLRRADAALVKSVREAIERVAPQARAPERAAEIFAADTALLCTWPEVDPFGPREGDYVGPQDDAAEGTPVSWAGNARPRLFAYLKPRDPRFGAIVESIRACGGEAIVAAPGVAPEVARALSSPALRVFGEVVAVGPLLADCDLCVSHAGPGIVARALEAGVPVALLPQQLEQFLVGRRAVSAGTGVMLSPEETSVDMARWLKDALSNTDLRKAARESTLRSHRPASAAARIAAVLGG